MQPVYKNVGESIETQRKDFKIQANRYLPTGEIPIVDQGADFIAGYIDDHEKIYTGPLPVIVFGDHTCCLKYISFRFAVGADGTQLIRPTSAFDVRFFYYALRAQKMEHFGYQRHFKFLKTKTVPWFPLTVQRKIASILSAYDDLIESNTRRIKILEEMAQMIYREWFVEFRFPGHEKVKMVDVPVETLHATSLQKMPEGWEVSKLQDVVELCYGKALKSEDRKEGPYPVYGSSGIVGYHSYSLVDGPGIIVGRKGNIGSVHWTDKPFYPIDTVYYVKTNISLYYTFFNLQQQNFINNDAAVPGLNRNQAYALPFLMPAKKQMEAFDEVCIPVFSTLRNLRSKNQNLRQTRDLLLPKLISGVVDVECFDININVET